MCPPKKKKIKKNNNNNNNNNNIFLIAKAWYPTLWSLAFDLGYLRDMNIPWEWSTVCFALCVRVSNNSLIPFVSRRVFMPLTEPAVDHFRGIFLRWSHLSIRDKKGSLGVQATVRTTKSLHALVIFVNLPSLSISDPPQISSSRMAHGVLCILHMSVKR